MKQGLAFFGIVIFAVGVFIGALVTGLNGKLSGKTIDPVPVVTGLKPGVYCLYGSPLVPVLAFITPEGNPAAVLANSNALVSKKDFPVILPCPDN